MANWLKLSDRWVNLDRLVIVKPGQVTLDAPGYPLVPGLHLDNGQDIEHVTNPADIGKVLAALDARCQLPHAPASLVPVPDADGVAAMRRTVEALEYIWGNGKLPPSVIPSLRADITAARAVLARIDDAGVRAEVEGDGPEGDS